MFPETVKILICDDSSLSRRVLRTELTKHNFKNIVEVVDGESAVKAASEATGENSFGLIFLDIVMPGINGIEAAEQIRKLPAPYLNVPIIMVSAEADRPTVIRALSKGANNYIIKPFQPGTVIEKMQAVFQKIRQPT